MKGKHDRTRAFKRQLFQRVKTYLRISRRLPPIQPAEIAQDAHPIPLDADDDDEEDVFAHAEEDLTSEWGAAFCFLFLLCELSAIVCVR